MNSEMNRPDGIGLSVESCSQPAIETDRDLNITGLNRPSLDFFGRDPEDLLGRPLFGRFLLPHDGRPAPTREDGLASRLVQALPGSGVPSFFLLTHIPLDKEQRLLFILFDITGEIKSHRELASQQSINLVVSSITNRLLDISAEDLHQNIVEICRTLSMFLAAEACYVVRWLPSRDRGEILQGWWREKDTELDSETLNDIVVNLPEFIEQLRKMDTVHQIADDPNIKPYYPERPGLKYLKRRGAKAVIASPLIQSENMLGFLVCERHSLARGWPPDEVMMLRTVSEALSSTLARLDAESQLRKQTQFMNLLTDTLQTGVMVSNMESGLVIRLNQHAKRLIGSSSSEIVDQPRSRFLHHATVPEASGGSAHKDIESSDWLLKPLEGRPLNVLRTAARAHDGEMDYLVECFSDITALKNLLENQSMDTVQARRILDLVEGARPRHLSLEGGLELFVSAYNLSSMDEGGDHYFIRELPASTGHPSGRLLVSLKDQSGHQVGCMLRCILTDLLHQRLLDRFGDESLEMVVQRLNSLLCDHSLLEQDDFFTAVFCQIDRHTKQMDFLSCGHPRFFLIRDDSLRFLPVAPGKPGSNLPLGLLGKRKFKSDDLILQAGDRIILYTDGLMEAAGCCSSLGREYGTEELAEMVLGLAQDHSGKKIEGLLDGILGAISKDGQCLLTPEGKNISDDDVTLIGLEVEDHSWDSMEVWRPASLRNLQDLMDRYYEQRREEWIQKGFENPQRLKLCLEEAVSNAFWHGNHGKEGEAIIVHHRYGNDFHLQVTDNGAGFDWAKNPGLLHKPSPDSESDWGIFLMRTRSDHIKWNKAGNQLELAFSRRGPHGKETRRPVELTSLFACDLI